MIAKGEFTVAVNPQADAQFAAGRLTIDKVYTGDLQANGKGQMLSHRCAIEGSAGYVAIEKVTGGLHGKQGSFYLQHSGTMYKGEQKLQIHVVPDSGMDELVGLQGELMINIVDGRHFYEFTYSLDAGSNNPL